MSSSGADGEHQWCLRHNRVETAIDGCAASIGLVPFTVPSEPARAVRTVSQRDAAWDADGARWPGGHEE